ncbi:hypothetical protein BD413DRAFT_512798 [Trametes elegans]|nr:hypothetical protein BD413DRAFT_512798 [Trametes elegans]
MESTDQCIAGGEADTASGLTPASREPTYEPALNVLYHYGSEEDIVSYYDPEDPAEAEGPPASPDTRYSLRPGRRYYGRRPQQDEHLKEDAAAPYAGGSIQSNKRPRKPSDTGSVRATTPSQSASNENSPIVILSSDDEDINIQGIPDVRSPVHVHKVSRTRGPRELVRPAGAPLATNMQRVRFGSDAGISTSSYQQSSSSTKPSARGHGQRRSWKNDRMPEFMENLLHQLRTEFPNEDVAIGHCSKADGTISWGFRCYTCPNTPLIRGGYRQPRLCLHNFKTHIRSAMHNALSLSHHTRDAREASSTSASATVVAPAAGSSQKSASAGGSRTGRKRKGRAGDVVEDFLASVGLSIDLAGALRGAGIIDRSRMRGLGELPDPAYSIVDDALAGMGLDVTARALIRNGLKKCAG